MATRHKQAALAVAWRVLAVLAGLYVTYLVLATVLLASPILRSLVNTSEDVHLEYSWAFSPAPGRVHFEDLKIRLQDYNIEALITIDEGSADIALDPLFSRTFEARRAEVRGVSFRFRHKVSQVGKQGPRLAAYPPIEGFADPPLYTGPKPSGGSSGALWRIRTSDVTAALRELWVLEYRYQGSGLARGSFELHPTSYFQVGPASLQLNGGKLELGETQVAERMDVSLSMFVHGTQTQQVEGMEPLGSVDAELTANLHAIDLSFLDAYLGPRGDLNATGRGEVRARAKVERGVVLDGTEIIVESDDVSVGSARFRVQGRSLSQLSVVRAEHTQSADPELKVRLQSQHVELQEVPAAERSPQLTDLDAELHVSADLSRPMRVSSARMEPAQLSIPDLGWIKRAFFDDQERISKLEGSGDFELSASLGESGGFSGTTSGRVSRLELKAADVSVSGTADLALEVESAEREEAMHFEKLRLGLQSSTIGVSGRRSKPVRATLNADDFVVRTKEPTSARGTVDVHADDATALLPLVVESPLLRHLQRTLFGTDELKARAALEVADKKTRLDLLHARSGSVKARGYLARSKKGPAGAFLVSTPVANVGVNVYSGEVQVQLFVTDSWLSATGSERTN